MRKGLSLAFSYFSMAAVEFMNLLPADTTQDELQVVFLVGARVIQTLRKLVAEEAGQGLAEKSAEAWMAVLEKRTEAEMMKKDETIRELTAQREKAHEEMYQLRTECIRTAAEERILAAAKEAQMQEQIRALEKEKSQVRAQVEMEFKSAAQTEQEAVVSLLTKQMQELKAAAAAATPVNKSNLQGRSGEDWFYELANRAFQTHDGFQAEMTRNKSHSGDVILQFKQGKILVDVKNFQTSDIKSQDLKKLRRDMDENSHIRIAWMVSIDRPVPHFNKYPFMLDIQDEFVFCYINSLKHCENPGLLLQNAWYASMTLYERLLSLRTEDSRAVEDGRATIMQFKKGVEVELQSIRETRALIRNLQVRVDESEKNLVSLLNYEVHRQLEAGVSLVRAWWEKRMIRAEKSRVKSSVLFEAFHGDEPCLSLEGFRGGIVEILGVQKSRTSDFVVVGWALNEN